MNLMHDSFTGFAWSKWLYGLWAAVIGGGSSAAYGALSVLIVDPKDFNPQTSKFYQVAGLMFLFGALLAFFMYLKEHPLPEIISSETHQSVKITQTPLTGTGDGTITKTEKTSTTVKEKVPKKPNA